MAKPPNTGSPLASLPVTKPDGSIVCEGYTIPCGPAQRDDVSRLLKGDPKAPYLIVARYEGDRGICRVWPCFAILSGLGVAP